MKMFRARPRNLWKEWRLLPRGFYKVLVQYWQGTGQGAAEPGGDLTNRSWGRTQGIDVREISWWAKLFSVLGHPRAHAWRVVSDRSGNSFMKWRCMNSSNDQRPEKDDFQTAGSTAGLKREEKRDQKTRRGEPLTGVQVGWRNLWRSPWNSCM